MAQRLNSHIPGATFNITQPIIDTSTEIATGSSADLAVIVTGPDLSVLRRLAADVLNMVRTVPGAADTSIEQEGDQPQLRIAVDRGVLARYGLNISDVQDVIELAIGGRAVGAVFEGERRFDVTVRYVPEARTDPAAIAQILVATPGGGRVPLGQLARVETVRGPSIIARRENERQMTVRTNIRERDQGGFVSEAQAKVPHPSRCHPATASVGRSIRESGEGPRTADYHSAGDDSDRVRLALRRVRVRA